MFVSGYNKKLTCPECRKIIDVPGRGVKAFTDNRYVEEILEMKKIPQCPKHFLPLHLFCDNTGCQTHICSSCAAVKHKGHHIVEPDEKVECVMTEMSITKDHVSSLIVAFGKHLEKLSEAIDMVNSSTSKNLDEIDDAREKLHKKVKELHEKIQAETEMTKIELLKNRREISKKLNKAREDTIHAKREASAIYKDIEISMEKRSNDELIQRQDSIDKDLSEMRKKLRIKKSYDIEVNMLKYTKPNIPSLFRFDDFGKLQVQPLVVRLQDMMHEPTKLSLVSRSKVLRAIDAELDKWPHTKMCVNKDGLIVLSGKVTDRLWLKCIRPDGNCLWQIQMGKITDETCRICGLYCVQ